MENVLKKICSLTFDTFCEHIMQSDIPYSTDSKATVFTVVSYMRHALAFIEKHLGGWA